MGVRSHGPSPAATEATFTKAETAASDAFAPTRREWRAVVLIWLAALILWVPYYMRSRPIALQWPDAQDYAQIARNIYRGHGMVTDTMPLNGFEWMRQTGRLGQPWHNVHRFPLPSFIEAAFFKVFGISDFGTALFSAVFFFATIPLVFLFARRLFSPRVALLSTFLYAFSAGMFTGSIDGLTEPAAIFFFLLTLYLVLWPRNLSSYVWAGVITGLAYLNRSSIVLYAVPLVFLIYKTARLNPWKALAAFVLPAALVTLPYLLYNLRVAGDPLFSLTTATMVRMHTPDSPTAADWYQFVYVKPFGYMLHHPAWMVKKWIKETIFLWKNSRDIGGLEMLFPFFVLSIFKPQASEAERLRRFLFGIFLLQVAAMGLLSSLPRYYMIFAPLMVIFAADAVLWGWDAARERVRVRAAALAFGAALMLPLLFHWMDRFVEPIGPGDPTQSAREISKDNPNWLKANTPSGALLASDIPWTTAWYADRKCVPIPPSPAAMSEWAKYKVRIDGIYLKAPRLHPGVPDGWENWRKVQEGRRPIPGFRLVKVFPDKALYYAHTR